MKIIKQGNLPENMTFEGICSYCKTQVEFAYHEAKFVSDQRDGDFVKIDCPLCRRIITVAYKLGVHKTE